MQQQTMKQQKLKQQQKLETTTEAGNHNRNGKQQQKLETTTENETTTEAGNKHKTRTSAHHWAEFKNIFEPFASFDRSGGDAAD